MALHLMARVESSAFRIATIFSQLHHFALQRPVQVSAQRQNSN
jgi:hypothetical protein